MDGEGVKLGVQHTSLEGSLCRDQGQRRRDETTSISVPKPHMSFPDSVWSIIIRVKHFQIVSFNIEQIQQTGSRFLCWIND